MKNTKMNFIVFLFAGAGCTITSSDFQYTNGQRDGGYHYIDASEVDVSGILHENMCHNINQYNDCIKEK